MPEFFSHNFVEYATDGSDGEPPPGTYARCGFILPVGFEPRPHNPETDTLCPECVAVGRRVDASRSLLVRQGKLVFTEGVTVSVPW